MKSKTGIILEKQDNRSARDNRASLFLLLFSSALLAINAFSLIEIFTSSFAIAYQKIMFWSIYIPGTVIIAAFLTLEIKKRYKYFTLLLFFTCIGFFFRYEIMSGITLLIQPAADQMWNLYDTSMFLYFFSDEMSLTICILLFSILLFSLYTCIFHNWFRTWPVFILPGIFLIMIYSLAKSPSTVSLLIYVCTALCIYTLGTSMRKTQNPHASPVGRQISVFMSAVLVVCLLAGGFAYAIIPLNYDSVASIKEDITDFYKAKNMYYYGDGDGDVYGGMAYGYLGNTGKIRYTNTDQYQVTVYKKPDTTIYLKGYTGTTYSSDMWDSEGYYEDEISPEMLTFLFDDNVDYLDIESMDHVIDPGLRPYFSTWDYASDPSALSSVQSEVDASVSVLPYGFLYSPEFYTWAKWDREQFYKHFDDYLPSYHSTDPSEDNLLVPGWLENFRETYYRDDLNELEDIINYVQETVSTCASYTLTPGLAPEGEDFLEYFMFQNKKGFCMHFATAATLMFRLHGVEARYVEGYIVSPDDFRTNKDSGMYEAMVKDSKAHAWTEIYLNGLGWIPIETTPGYTTLDQPQDEPQAQQLPEQTNQTNRQTPRTSQGSSRNELSFELTWKSLLFFPVFFVFIVGIVFCRYFILSNKKRRAFRLKDSGMIHTETQRLLKYSGYIREPLDSELSNAQKVESYLHYLEKDSYVKYTNLILKQSFGNGELEKSEKQYLLDIYTTLWKHTNENLSSWKRLWYKYIHCFVI